MHVLVDERPEVTGAYLSSFQAEGIASLGFKPREFADWFRSVSTQDIDAVQSFLLGDFDGARAARN